MDLKSLTPVERFWLYTNKRGPIHPAHGRCWVWTGQDWGAGYGCLKVKGRRVKAHRFSYELHSSSELKPSLKVLHKCDNRRCVNPNHLFVGSDADNVRDMCRKNRVSHGEARPAAKITSSIARYIKANYIRRHREYGSVGLGKRFGISHVVVLNIVSGKSWTRA